MILGIFDKQVNQYEMNKIGLVIQPIKTPNKRTIMTEALVNRYDTLVQLTQQCCMGEHYV